MPPVVPQEAAHTGGEADQHDDAEHPSSCARRRPSKHGTEVSWQEARGPGRLPFLSS